jgi:hypothetical protein
LQRLSKTLVVASFGALCACSLLTDWSNLSGERDREDESGPPDADLADTNVPSESAAADAPVEDAALDAQDAAATGACRRDSGAPIELARDKPASADRSRTGNPPGEAVDGDAGTYWTSGDTATNISWTVDLGSTYALRSLVIAWESSAAEYTFQVATATNTAAFTAATDSTVTRVGAKTTVTFDATPCARYVRITRTGSSSWWNSMREVEVYGDP